MTTPHPSLAIDVWADIACPWCWIGERRLRGALARLAAAHPEVVPEIRWRPYQLQPQLPPGGADWATFVREKFGGADEAAGMFAHVARAGEAEAIPFRFDRVAVAPNTSDAHRLVLAAGDRALDAAEALFAAYFAEGRNVSDRATLAALAPAWGTTEADARAVLDSDAHALEVQGAMREAQRLGIRGVPFIVLDERLAVSGAQPAALFDRALAAALEPA